MDQNQDNDAHIELEDAQECNESGALVPPTPGENESTIITTTKNDGKGP